MRCYKNILKYSPVQIANANREHSRREWTRASFQKSRSFASARSENFGNITRFRIIYLERVHTSRDSTLRGRIANDADRRNSAQIVRPGPIGVFLLDFHRRSRKGALCSRQQACSLLLEYSAECCFSLSLFLLEITECSRDFSRLRRIQAFRALLPD